MTHLSQKILVIFVVVCHPRHIVIILRCLCPRSPFFPFEYFYRLFTSSSKPDIIMGKRYLGKVLVLVLHQYWRVMHRPVFLLLLNMHLTYIYLKRKAGVFSFQKNSLLLAVISSINRYIFYVNQLLDSISFELGDRVMKCL